MTSMNTNKPKEASEGKVTKYLAASRRWEMTPARRKALKTGEAIRNIICMDSIANRFFDPMLRNQVRELCDQQMNLLGYESLTEHRKRISDLWGDPKANTLSDREFDKLMKYKRLDDITGGIL